MKQDNVINLSEHKAKAQMEYQSDSILEGLMQAADTGNKDCILIYLEELSKRYADRTPVSCTPAEERDILETYAYFTSNLSHITYSERIEKWGTESCAFLEFAQQVADSVYARIASKIQKNMDKEKHNKIQKIVEQLEGYIMKGCTVNLQFLSPQIPNFSISLNSLNYKRIADKDSITTACDFIFMTEGIFKGTIVTGNVKYLFAYSFYDRKIHPMKGSEILKEFYTSPDGKYFDLEENTKLLMLSEENS